MKKIGILILACTFCCSNGTKAQLPNTFYPVAHNTNYGAAFDVVRGPDGTIFVGYYSGGLRVYTYDGNSFVNTAIFNEIGTIYGLAIGKDGTLFIDTGSGGISTYTFDGVNLAKIAHLEGVGYTSKIVISDDGTTLFIADGNQGLSAYSFNGSSFARIGEINSGGSANSVAIGKDGTIFLANGSDGVRSYLFNGSSFTPKGYTTIVGGSAYDIKTGPNDMVYTAFGQEGLLAVKYDYNKDQFTGLPAGSNYGAGYSVKVAVNPEGIVFLLNDKGYLGAFIYNGLTMVKRAEIILSGSCYDMDIVPDGTVYVARGTLDSYYFSGSSFISKARTVDGGDAKYISTDSAGIITLANTEGLRTYIRKGNILENKAYVNDKGEEICVMQDPDSTIFSSSTEGIKAYHFDGSSLTESASINLSNLGMKTTLKHSLDGAILWATENNKMKAFTFNGTSFTNTATVTEGFGGPHDIAVRNDGIIFLGDDKLRAYSYSGSSFTQLASIDVEGFPNSIAIGPDNLIFVGQESIYGLHAYTFNGNSFSNVAHIDAGGQTEDIAIGNDGTIFLANGSGGLKAYTFNGASFNLTAHADIDGYVHHIAIDSNGVILAACGGSGLYAFVYTLPDIEPPTTPGVVIPIDITSKSISFEWTPSLDDKAFAGYHIFVNNAQVGNSLSNSFELRNLHPNTEYTISVSAYDQAANVSSKSQSVTVSTLMTGTMDIYISDSLDYVQVFPNPANDFLIIESENVKSFSIQISSINGQILRNQEIHVPVYHMSMESLPKGIYFATIRLKSSTRIFKIIKQ